MFGSRREAVPESISFLPAEDWRVLTKLVDPIVRKLGGTRDGTTVQTEDGQVALENLARACHSMPRAKWSREVQNFLRGFVPDGSVDPLAVIQADPVAAQELLRVRPYPVETFEGLEYHPVSAPLAGGLHDILCLDFPDRVAMLNQEMAAAFSIDAETLLARGLANVRAEPAPAEIDRIEVEPGVAIEIFADESFYAVTWARWIDALIPGLGPEGALVVMPTRHQIAVHPLRTARGASAAPGPLLQVAKVTIADGAGPVSPELFWWHAVQLVHLPGRITETGAELSPPEEYLAMLERLEDDAAD